MSFNRRNEPKIKCFADAEKMFVGKKSDVITLCGRETKLVRICDEVFKITYHDYPIVTYRALWVVEAGYVYTTSVNNFGYFTMSTKSKINRYTKIGLMQKEFIWYYGQNEFNGKLTVVEYQEI